MNQVSVVDPALIKLILSLATILGLLVGSFLNVVIWRVPRGQSVVAPPSACPSCSSVIRWFDNVPVASWLFLRGKCRNCKTGISARYPLVEALTALVFLLTTWRIVGSGNFNIFELCAFLYLAALGVALAFIDLDTHKLPNKIVLPAYIVVPILLVGANVLTGWDWALAIRTLLGCVVLYAFYFVLCVVGGMGFGDVKLAGVLGLSLGWLGWEYVVVGGFLPFIVGGVFSVALLLLKRATRKSGIPFGPWMILGWFIALFAAGPISDWYLGSFIL